MPPKSGLGRAKKGTKGRSSLCSFSGSKVGPELLQDFVNYGTLTQEGWRAPKDERVPDPRPGEHVFFTKWLDRGFTPPGSEFLRELLHFYGLRPQDIPPNSLLYITMYTVLCEGYLGIKPSLLLFRYLFRCKEHREKAKGRFVQCGAISFTRRSRVEFPMPHFPKKVVDWQSTFFYCKCTSPEGQFDFLLFSEDPFSPGDKFAVARMPLTDEEMQSIEPLRSKLLVLMKRGLRSRNLVASWILMEVSPLSDRSQLLCQYTGTSADPGRWSSGSIDLKNLKWWMSLCVTDSVKSLDVGGIPPFCSSNDVPQDFWNPDCDAVNNSDWNLSLEEEEEAEEVDSYEGAEEQEPDCEVLLPAPRKCKSRKRSRQVCKKEQSSYSISAREAEKTTRLERTVKRQRLSRTSMKATLSPSPSDLLSILETGDHSSSCQGPSSENEMNVDSSGDDLSDSDEGDLPPIAEGISYSELSVSPGRDAMVLYQSPKQADTNSSPMIRSQGVEWQVETQVAEKLADCAVTQVDANQKNKESVPAERISIDMLLDKLLSNLKDDECTRKNSLEARFNQIMEIKAGIAQRSELDVSKIQAEMAEAVNRANNLECNLKATEELGNQEIHAARVAADERIKSAELDKTALENTLKLKQNEIDRLHKEKKSLEQYCSKLVGQICATAVALFSGFKESSLSSINDKSPEDQLLAIRDFTSFIKLHVSELLQSLVCEAKQATTAKAFKDQCAGLKDLLSAWKMSSARAGACKALALAKAHYPVVIMENIAKGRPRNKRDGTLLSDEEYKEISKSCRPFGTRVAEFVNVNLFHRAYGMDSKTSQPMGKGTAKGALRASPMLATTGSARASSSSHEHVMDSKLSQIMDKGTAEEGTHASVKVATTGSAKVSSSLMENFD